jgi:hypothetical protein
MQVAAARLAWDTMARLDSAITHQERSTIDLALGTRAAMPPPREAPRVGKTHSPETLARNIFSLMLIGIVIEMVVMVILPRVRF